MVFRSQAYKKISLGISDKVFSVLHHTLEAAPVEHPCQHRQENVAGYVGSIQPCQQMVLHASLDKHLFQMAHIIRAVIFKMQQHGCLKLRHESLGMVEYRDESGAFAVMHPVGEVAVFLVVCGFPFAEKPFCVFNFFLVVHKWGIVVAARKIRTEIQNTHPGHNV